MDLIFPNPSRSYDASRAEIRFWAYDRTMEVVFSINSAALLRIDSKSGTDEAGLLETFDINRDRIHRLANKVYSHRHFGPRVYSFTLTASDF